MSTKHFPNTQALGEGWALFSVDGRYALQRDDETGTFDSDADAIIFVAERARQGSEYHRRALSLLGTLVPVLVASGVRCPECGNRHFQIVVRQMADVEFDEDGDHEITDGPYGDIDWDDESFVICSTNLYGCGWAGTLAEATVSEGEAK